MHARTVRALDGSARGALRRDDSPVPAVERRLAGAERVTEIHPIANFSYMNAPARRRPVPGGGRRDRVRRPDLLERRSHRDPVGRAGGRRRSTRRSPTGASRPRASRPTSARCGAGSGPFFRFIHKYYEPAFFELFLRPEVGLGRRRRPQRALGRRFHEDAPEHAAGAARALRRRPHERLGAPPRWACRSSRGSSGEVPANPARLPLHHPRHRDRRGRAGGARRDERAHRALHRGRRPVRARPDLGGRTRHGHGRRASPPAACCPAATHPRDRGGSRRLGRAGAGHAAARSLDLAVHDAHAGAGPRRRSRRCRRPTATTRTLPVRTGPVPPRGRPPRRRGRRLLRRLARPRAWAADLELEDESYEVVGVLRADADGARSVRDRPDRRRARAVGRQGPLLRTVLASGAAAAHRGRSQHRRGGRLARRRGSRRGGASASASACPASTSSCRAS